MSEWEAAAGSHEVAASELTATSEQLAPVPAVQKIEAALLRAGLQQARQEASSQDPAAQDPAPAKKVGPRPDAEAHDPVEQERLGKIQRDATLSFAKGFKIESEDAMAQVQADFMKAENAKRNVTQEQHVAEASLYQKYEFKLSPAEEKQWTARAAVAAGKIVAYCATKHPELKLTVEHFKYAIRECDEGGAFAYCNPGEPFIYVGQYFTMSAESNPAYVVDVLVHELHGHPEYGAEYGSELYLNARGKMNGDSTDASLSSSEFGNYGYQETEIFANLRQYPYEVPVPKEHKFTYSVKENVLMQLKQIRSEWEPRIAMALIHGLNRRIRVTPEITPDALKLFAELVTECYADQPGAAEKILA